MPHWYDSLAALRSLGSQHAGVGSLGDLHRARAEHLSQFFTPSALAEVMWRLVQPAMARVASDERVLLFDNSVGSGRLLQYADPARHLLAGCDVHGASLDALKAAVAAAGFAHDLVNAGMHEIAPGRYHVGLINPPFSIHFDSPTLKPYPCNTYGRFGAGRACLSHVYALAQALDCCQVVVALLPRTFADELPASEFFSPRLRLLLDLPGDAFVEEGARVDTTIAVFDSLAALGWQRHELARLTDLPDLDLVCHLAKGVSFRPISVKGVDATSPTILTPVTGDNAVRVVRAGRKVSLRFKCGLTEARVLNGIYDRRLDHYDRPPGCAYPSGLVFAGEGRLDLEVYLAQGDPMAAFAGLVADIERHGGRAEVDPGLHGWLRRRARRMAVHAEPLAHTIRVATASVQAGAEVVALKSFPLNPKAWSSPVFRRGGKYQAQRRDDGSWLVRINGTEATLTEDVMQAHFEMPEAQESWVRKFPGRTQAFRDLARHSILAARRAKLDRFLSWKDYQLADLIEANLSPFGVGLTWSMGLGKSRLAIGLCLIRQSRRNLIVVEAHLVDEMRTELRQAPVGADDWQVIESTEDLKSLRRVNVITYNRLRAALSSQTKRTYAHALRNRIHTIVCDEGHHLRNLQSAQTRAVWQVNARRKFLLTGTPIANYPRDVFPLLLWLGGDGTAAQPYGLRHAKLEAHHILTMGEARRGIDEFREKFVTLEWSVNEFDDTMSEGAKREVPKIANLPAFRMLLAPFFKRRLDGEPDVAKYIRIPAARSEVKTVEWDAAHLALYRRVADEFRDWYCAQREQAGAERRNLNLVALLARIGAVEQAANDPASGVRDFASLAGFTSKQRAVLDRALEFVAEGHKTIVYAKSPRLLERLADLARERGVESVVVHGGRDIATRTRELNERFRFGPVPLLFASLGCTQTGLNLWQASRAIFLSRDWRAITERQAAARLLRPQQTKKVLCEFYHLPGSIDEYQAMMSGMKADASDSGLDWAAPTRQQDEFLHIDHILGRFCADLKASEIKAAV